MDVRESFGIRLKELREDSGLTQGQLAFMVGLSPKYISNLETGRGNPTLAIQNKLAHGLGVSISELTNGVEGDL